jgi:uncharacterized alpha-E superfamily protein
MLSRDADSLYWLARYVERAENIARILEVTYRLASLPDAYGAGYTNEWESALTTAGVLEGYRAEYGEVSPERVIEFLAVSDANPTSIRRCFAIARQNARSVRGGLTAEMWDVINRGWLDMQSFGRGGLEREGLGRFVDWVKEVSLRFDGSALRTMLRSDAFWFNRLGVYLERADNTARVLDVKYHILLPRDEEIGGGLDYHQWAAILRSVSALVSYQWVYRRSLRPWLVADLLILREEMPRSLAACYASLSRSLDDIAGNYGESGPSQRLARSTHALLGNARLEDIFQSGLHQFVQRFVVDNNQLGAAIAAQYLQ